MDTVRCYIFIWLSDGYYMTVTWDHSLYEQNVIFFVFLWHCCRPSLMSVLFVEIRKNVNQTRMNKASTVKLLFVRNVPELSNLKLAATHSAKLLSLKEINNPNVMFIFTLKYMHFQYTPYCFGKSCQNSIHRVTLT